MKYFRMIFGFSGDSQIIVNCCGPYRFYGEAVVKAWYVCKLQVSDVLTYDWNGFRFFDTCI